MNLTYTVLFLVAAALAWFFIRHGAMRARRIRLSEFDNWKDLDVHNKLERLCNSRVRQIDVDTAMWRAFLTFCVIVMGFGTLALIEIEGVANDAKQTAEDLCAVSAEFRELESAGLTEDIRQTQAERDRLADSLVAAETRTEETPGFELLGPGIKRFLAGLITRQIADGQARLNTIDADLAGMRQRVDDIRSFNRIASCPT